MKSFQANIEPELFSSEKQAELIKIFSLKFIADIKELHSLLAKRNENNDGVNAWVIVDGLIKALNEDELSKVPAYAEMINNEINGINFDANSGAPEKNNSYRKSRVERLLTQILTGIILAFPGFKLGAAIGVSVGGGVFSVPAAVIGGGVGAVVGLVAGGFFASYAHTKLRPHQATQVAKYDKLVSIRQGLQNQSNGMKPKSS